MKRGEKNMGQRPASLGVEHWNLKRYKFYSLHTPWYPKASKLVTAMTLKSILDHMQHVSGDPATGFWFNT